MTLSAREGIAAVALLAMYSDDVLLAEEDEELRDRLGALPPFEKVSDHEMGELLSGIERSARKLGAAALLAQACQAIPSAQRLDAYLLAAQIVLSDGEVAHEESDYLRRLRTKLGLTEGDVASLGPMD